MTKKIIKSWFSVVWGPLKADRVPKMQFPMWGQNIKVVMCDFEIGVISKSFQLVLKLYTIVFK